MLILRRVTGHSMMPILPPNALIIGLKSTKRLKIGQVVIFDHDGKEKVKRIKNINNQNELFLEGDHLIASTDSRHFGWLPDAHVIAKVIWPRCRF
jgi:nickel-type superoxide dismutase maturation protease